MTAIADFFKSHQILWQSIMLVFTAVVTFVLVFFALRLEKKAAKRLRGMRDNINLRFVESIVRFIVIFLAVQFVVMSSPLTQNFGRVLFQGTTVVAAIAGFAAQPVIADLICGMMLSATKPFDIGNRIELDDGTAGIVKDITLRHVTLQDIDTVVRIIPNSKLNGMKITNMSYQTQKRSVHFRFHVAYHADVEQAKAVIARAVADSPWSIPGGPDASEGAYSPVYFISYADSSLVFATTVYYNATTRTEVLKDDVNSRVKQALDAAGIEIPYNYVNVVLNDSDSRKEGRA